MKRPSNVLILSMAFCVALAGTFVFAYRAGRHARRLRFESEPIRPWMSIPFVAHTHHVPPGTLFTAAGLDAHRHDHRPLRVIARDQHRAVDDLIRDLNRALAATGHAHAQPGRGTQSDKAP